MIEGLILSTFFIFLATVGYAIAYGAMKSDNMLLFLGAALCSSGSLAFGITMAAATALRVGGYT